MNYARQMERAMVFVDGTNLFYRLEAEKLRIGNFSDILHDVVDRGTLVRAYLYTSKPHYEKAQSIHGENFAQNFRVVFGDAPPTGDGNFKEKGVDALLVADLIYHAANKNYDFAVLISVDTDFVFAIRRVEDFGCQTKVVGVCADVPKRLRLAADSVRLLTKERLIQSNIATEYKK